MAGPTQVHAPLYISSRSADVILSDIRPTKLNIDALHSINVLLDEFLYNILSVARSLATDQLRAGLHKVLPTALGKEALLEAEVELRAHWERTGSAAGSGSSHSRNAEKGANFHLQWMFELLRLKCEAYSTLSDTDEDPEAESRLYERMDVDGVTPPKEALLTPAALYLTAILESVCENVLSNVGRVATRDSSRTTANVQDLFVALCEDGSIYNLFKSMRVYEQIENLSKATRPRRSKSFSREKQGDQRTPASHDSELPPKQTTGNGNGMRSRISSDSPNNGPSAVATPVAHSSRTSFEKARAMKMFVANSRTSIDYPTGNEPNNGHKKAESVGSVVAKQSIYSDKSPVSSTFSDDSRSQEFDSMMRSGSTMKVSLTPDRLKTMEVFNREKERLRQKSGARALTQTSDADTTQKLPTPAKLEPIKQRTKRPSLRHVDSIIEDEEFVQDPASAKPPVSRPRQMSSASAAPQISESFTRFRSASTSSPVVKSPAFPVRQSSRSETTSFPMPPSSTTNMAQNREKHLPKHFNVDATKPRRVVARNRESMDLDDIMGTGSSDMDEVEEEKGSPQKNSNPKISASAQELIAFLAEGPPDIPEVARANDSIPFLTTPKKSGRLQKMISRLTLNGSAEKVRLDGNIEVHTKGPHRKHTISGSQSQSPQVPLLPSKSMTNLAPLVNKPVPPRYPPASPSSSDTHISVENQPASDNRPQGPIPRKAVPSWDQKSSAEPPIPSLATAINDEAERGVTRTYPVIEVDAVKKSLSSSSAQLINTELDSTRAAIPIQITTVKPAQPTVQAPERRSSKGAFASLTKTATSVRSVTPTASLGEHARDMRRLLSHATSAEECRLLVDIFLTRSNLLTEAMDFSNPYPSPLSDVQTQTSPTPDAELQSSLVEFLLEGGQEHLSTTNEPEVQLSNADSVTSTSIFISTTGSD